MHFKANYGNNLHEYFYKGIAVFELWFLSLQPKFARRWTMYSESDLMNLSRVSNPRKNPVKIERRLNHETLNPILSGTNHIWAASKIKAAAKIP